MENENNADCATSADCATIVDCATIADCATNVASFEDMGLSDNLLRGIYAYGFENPSPIQQKGIVPFIQGKEVIAQAQSGTGKTGCFAISLLQCIDTNKPVCQALVISPTRELTNQTGKVISSIGHHLNVGVRVCVGGASVSEDIRHLHSRENPVHIVVGSPGRIYDLLCRDNGIDGSRVKYLILDEADEMLNYEGFQNLTYEIFQELPKDIQVGLYSATLPPDVLSLTQQFMKDAIRIIVQKEQLTLEGIRQYYIQLDNDHQKFDTLCDIYKDLCIGSSVIFCNTRRMVQTLTELMTREDFAVSQIHGAMSSEERKQVMNSFRNGETRVLVTTDLLSRGIDVQGVSIVINYDLRYGRKGMGINMVTPDDFPKMRHLEKYYETFIEELPVNFAELI
jgi:translation initiation factor 4A